jgi:hypothetical protein
MNLRLVAQRPAVEVNGDTLEFNSESFKQSQTQWLKSLKKTPVWKLTSTVNVGTVISNALVIGFAVVLNAYLILAQLLSPENTVHEKDQPYHT